MVLIHVARVQSRSHVECQISDVAWILPGQGELMCLEQKGLIACLRSWRISEVEYATATTAKPEHKLLE